ncbi:MAG: hypothetical protein ACJ76N_05935 [Thermoanaerobaculia bacterium]
MRRLVMLCLMLALVLSSKTALAVPYCSCEICLEDGDQTCQEYWTGLFRPCVTYYGIYCRG